MFYIVYTVNNNKPLIERSVESVTGQTVYIPTVLRMKHFSYTLSLHILVLTIYKIIQCRSLTMSESSSCVRAKRG